MIEKNKGAASQSGNNSGSGNDEKSHDSEKSSGSGVNLPKNKIRYEGLPIPLIMDGKVQDDNLELI